MTDEMSQASDFKYTTILFDLHETLVELNRPYSALYAEVAKGHGVTIGESMVPLAFRKVWRTIGEEVITSDHMLPTSHVDIEEWWANFHSQVLATITTDVPLEIRKKIGVEINTRHCSDPAIFKLCPNAKETLEWLVSNGISCVLLTNADSRTEKIVRSHAIFDYFDQHIYAGSVGYCKPNPKILNEHFASINLQSGDTTRMLIVGDSDLFDVQTGVFSGIDTCIYKKTSPRATHMISDLRELKAIVQGRIPAELCVTTPSTLGLALNDGNTK